MNGSHGHTSESHAYNQIDDTVCYRVVDILPTQSIYIYISTPQIITSDLSGVSYCWLIPQLVGG